MIVSRRLLVVLLVLGLGAGCTSDGGDSEPGAGAKRRTPTTASGSGPAEAEGADSTEALDSEAPPAEKGPTSVFSGVTTTPPIPVAEFEISLTGAVTAKASGAARTRCLQGDGYFDVEVTPDVPFAAGDIAITSVVLGAPGFRGPGRYDAARADDAEWSVGLADVENGAPSEFYSPLDGASGAVTIAADGKSGSFEVRGLVADDGGTLAASGRFTCGVVEG